MAENKDKKKEKRTDDDEKPRIKPGDIICNTETYDTVSTGNVVYKSNNRIF